MNTINSSKHYFDQNKQKNILGRQQDIMDKKFDITAEQLDISNIENDFIYKLISYYLDDISLEPVDDIIGSITNLVDTIMSFYLLAKKNGRVDIENSRKILAIKMNNNNILETNITQTNITQTNMPVNNDNISKIGTEFSSANKYISDKLTYDIPRIDDLLLNHEKFMLELSHADQKLFDKKNITNEVPKYQSNQAKLDLLKLLEDKLVSDTEIAGNHIKNKSIHVIPDKTILTKILNTSDEIVIKKYTKTNPLTKTNQPKTDKDIIQSDPNLIKLDIAYNQLCSRLNTPSVNLFGTIFVIKIINYLFGC